jgi:hypothetical protein
MSRFPRRLNRILIASALAAGMAGGIAAIPASASSSSSVARMSVTPDDTWLAGEYYSLYACQQAGARGVRAGKWTNYICYPDLVKVNVYWLDVTDEGLQ